MGGTRQFGRAALGKARQGSEAFFALSTSRTLRGIGFFKYGWHGGELAESRSKTKVQCFAKCHCIVFEDELPWPCLIAAPQLDSSPLSLLTGPPPFSSQSETGGAACQHPPSPTFFDSLPSSLFAFPPRQTRAYRTGLAAGAKAIPAERTRRKRIRIIF